MRRQLVKFLVLTCLCFYAGTLSAQIEGIFITSKADEILTAGRPTVKGVEISQITIPGGEDKLKELLKPYLGKPLTRENVIEVKQKIMLYFVSQQHSKLGVSLPEQETTGGVIQVLVDQKQFGKMITKGESWYDDAQLSRLLSVSPGQQISEDTLQNNLSWLNRNPFHSAKSKWVPTDNPQVVDLQITTKTRSPIRLYDRFDDTGNAATGYGRFATGFAWGNAFGVGDLLSFEYGFSNRTGRYRNYMLNYTSFLPCQHILTLLTQYCEVKPIVPVLLGPSPLVNASSTQVRLHYTVPFKPLHTPLQQSMIFGLEYKNIKSHTTIFALLPQISPPYIIELNQNITQFYFNYAFYNVMKRHDISFSVDVFASLGKLIPHESNATYEAVRAHSRNKYAYTRLTFADVYTIPKKCQMSFLLRGQASTGTLPVTEMSCIGGYNTVRGYHEAAYFADNSFIANFELRTLPYKFWPCQKGELIFLGFVDYGVGMNWFIPKYVGVATPPHCQWLLGVGPGLRYRINPYLQVRADYGFKLHDLFIGHIPALQQLRGNYGQFHFGILGSY